MYGEFIPGVYRKVQTDHQFLAQTTSALPEALNSLLDAYQDIGERIPHLQRYQSLFVSIPYFKDIVVMIYKDILWFHRETIRQLKQRREYPGYLTLLVPKGELNPYRMETAIRSIVERLYLESRAHQRDFGTEQAFD